MAADRPDPRDQISEADLLDQQTAVDPRSSIDAEAEPSTPDSPASLVDEGDRMEQEALLPDAGEDDYPYDSPDPGDMREG